MVPNGKDTPESSVHRLIMSQHQIVTRVLDGLVERTTKLQTWITSHFPRIVDGQQIGVVTRVLAQAAVDEAKVSETTANFERYKTKHGSSFSDTRIHKIVVIIPEGLIDCSAAWFSEKKQLKGPVVACVVFGYLTSVNVSQPSYVHHNRPACECYHAKPIIIVITTAISIIIIIIIIF